MVNSYSSELLELKNKNLYRELKIITPRSGRVIFLNGKEYINYASNDYLGLSKNKRVFESAVSAARLYGTGSASSRLLSGTYNIHDELENKLSKFKNSESALVFPSGYQTNLGVISSLVGEDDCVIIDRLNHASIIDGARLSKAKIFPYEHADAGSLEKTLEKAAGFKRRLIITDALFSMDGDMAPLNEIAELAKKYSAMLMIDEAHSTGVFGKNGSGLAEYFGLEDKIDVKMGTLSKALGSQGGFICVNGGLRDYIINKARGFIYTTALSPVSAAAALEAIKIIQESAEPRKRLLANARMFREKLKSLGYDTLSSESQIIPVLIGDTGKTIGLSRVLFEKGFYVPAVRYQTVPKNMARLRISLTSEHTDEDMEKLCGALRNA